MLASTQLTQLRVGEELESRLLLSNVSWTGGASTLNWTDAINWSGHAVPGASDNVTINIAVSGPIAIGSSAQSINSLTDSTASLVLSGGSLTLAANSSMSKSFTLSGGTLTPNAGLSVNSTTFNFNAGSIAGTVTLLNSALVIGTGSTGAASFVVEGSDTLTGNVAAGQMLSIQGSSAGGDAILNLGGNVSNAGAILLESSNGAYQSNIATGSSTLTNIGTITSSLGTGGNRIITGTLANQGTISADSNDYLEITGTYVAQGGTTTGPAELFNCQLFETSSPASASTIIIASLGDTLETDNLSGYTLWVNGNGLFNTDARLNLGGNVANRGAILLESSNSGYQSNIATGSSTLTNIGTITSSLGTGGKSHHHGHAGQPEPDLRRQQRLRRHRGRLSGSGGHDHWARLPGRLHAR